MTEAWTSPLPRQLTAEDDERLDAFVARLAARVEFTHPDVDVDVSAGEVSLIWTGPDSDDPDGASQRWDWLSGPDLAVLDALEEAVARGDEEAGLTVLAQRLHESLALNAVHEVGEWLRLNGVRPYGPHRVAQRTVGGDTFEIVDDGPQGNGAVTLTITYDLSAEAVLAAPPSVPAAVLDSAGRELLCRRLAAHRLSDAFTYRNGITVTLTPTGPIIRDETATDARSGRPVTVEVRRPWSQALTQTLDRPDEEFLEAVTRDVHRAIVTFELHEVGEFLLVDGTRLWDPHLAVDLVVSGAAAAGPDGCGPVRFVLSYDG